MKTIIKTSLFFLILLTTTTIFAQSWQWGKRGGGVGSGVYYSSREDLYAIVTDSDNNIYGLSKVYEGGIDIDGNTKDFLGEPCGTCFDIALVSFACDGSYRWSKIIGGKYGENMYNIKVDAQNNVYIVGLLSFTNIFNGYPPSIDTDWIKPYGPGGTYTYNCAAYIKFNSSCIFQWIKQPENGALATTEFLDYIPIDFDVDASGTMYSLCQVKPGTYFNGAFVATAPIYQAFRGWPYYIVKTDAAGNFVSAHLLDLKMRYFDIEMYRNPNNGNFTFTAKRYIDETVIPNNSYFCEMNGQTSDKSSMIFTYDSNYNFLWRAENTNSLINGEFYFCGLAFDANNNIYTTGKSVYRPGNSNTFLGYGASSVTLINSFAMKMNPNATSIIWVTPSTNVGTDVGATTKTATELIDGNRAYLTWTWGTQTKYINAVNNGSHPAIARFDLNTGACLGLHDISTNNAGSQDAISSLAVDSTGAIIAGGYFGEQLTFPNGTLYNAAAQFDFFIAKFSTSACSLGTQDQGEASNKEFVVNPNPTTDSISIKIDEPITYNITSITGQSVLQGALTENNNTINTCNLAAGSYLVQIKNQAGETKVVKLVKE